MPVTVIADPTDDAANSYVTVAEADAYHVARPTTTSAKWNAATADDKAAAVVTATELLDSAIQWTGAAVDPEQPLAWPRTGMVSRNGASIPDDEFPRDLKRATSEFARQVLAGNRLADNDVARAGITDLKVGSISLSFKEDQVASGVPAVVPDAILIMLPASWYIVPVTGPEIMLENM